MQFSNVADKNGIIQRIEQESPFGIGGISGNANELVKFTNRINEWQHKVNGWLQKVSGQQGFDDANHGNFNIEVYDIEDDKQDYGLTTGGESDSLVIKKVEIRDVSTGKYRTLSYLEQKDRPENEFGGDKGSPISYYMLSGSFIFDVPPDITLVDKFRITYDRNAYLFTIADTTRKPGFDVKFHEILVFGPLMDWAQQKGLAVLATFCFGKIYGTDTEQNIGLKREMEDWYSHRLREYRPVIKRKQTNAI